jgi:hypothetical protein
MADSNMNTTPNAVSQAQSVMKKEPHDYPEIRHRARPKVVKSVDKKKSNGKLAMLKDYLDGVKDQNFTGYIKVNFSQGSVGRIERFEEILRK